MGAYQISVPGHAASQEVLCMRELLTNQRSKLERFGFDLEEKRQGDRTIFTCLNRQLGRQREHSLRQQLGQAVADYLITVDEPAFIRQIIAKEFHYRDPQETRQIESYAFHLLVDTEDEVDEEYGSLHRKEKMAQQVAHYLTHTHFLAVDGYFHFRMKRYKKVLIKLVEHAIDEYLLDQEYQEFINLLRHFVASQPSKVPLIHVVHGGGKRRFHLLTVEGKPLSLNEMDGVVDELMADTLSQEDMIVSTLLTAAPEQVVLHSLNPEENVIRTLLQIFSGRITLCEGCVDCKWHFNIGEDG
ncbi:putative sporulation protein YtxC [Marininema mesophilum]|uniref:Putative sporulation protein YtxC n=1 Tax=Marininema mesophilum TaxID=1048340 RepID=A0A1H2XQZ0_9BACL|nr:putative sporulation protein YtxC [Marininema mesophilum]SDW95283.1 putative sporulation protein YtxC [Marininema mesophilum]